MYICVFDDESFDSAVIDILQYELLRRGEIISDNKGPVLLSL